jgi:hypothetical protein
LYCGSVYIQLECLSHYCYTTSLARPPYQRKLTDRGFFLIARAIPDTYHLLGRRVAKATRQLCVECGVFIKLSLTALPRNGGTMRCPVLLACAFLILCVEQTAAQTRSTEKLRITTPEVGGSFSRVDPQGLYSRAAERQFFFAAADRGNSKSRRKGMIIGGLIGMAAGILSGQLQEYSTESSCSLWCYTKRVGAGGSIGVIVGGIVGSATAKPDSTHLEHGGNSGYHNSPRRRNEH